MNDDILCAVLVGQIMVFQFLGAWLGSLGLAFVVGMRGLPEAISAQIAREDRRQSLTRLWAGAGLLLATGLLCGSSALPDPGRRLGLTAISLASTGLFVWGLIHEQRIGRRLRGRLPDPPTRTADLRGRRLGEVYPLILEALPPLLACATVLLTLWCLLHSGNSLPAGAVQAGSAPAGSAAGSSMVGVSSHAAPIRLSIWILPVLQGILLVGGLWAARRILSQARYLPQKARAFVADPADVLALDRSLRRLELRAFLAVRTLLMIILGLWQWKVLVRYGDIGPHLPANVPVSLLVWMLVLGMLLIFALFQSRVRQLRVRT